MKTVDQLKVGDIVWFDDVNNRRNNPPQECKVSKMGTKIIIVEYGSFATTKRFRKDTLRSDDTYAHQWLILDLQDEADKKERKRLLQKLSSNHVWRISDDVSLEDVRQALKLLRIDAE